MYTTQFNLDLPKKTHKMVSAEILSDNFRMVGGTDNNS